MADNPITYSDSGEPGYNEGLQVTIAPNASTPDLSLITSAKIVVQSRAGVVPTSPVIWIPSLSGQTTTTLTLNYPFQPGDRAIVGAYQLLVKLYISPSVTPIRMVPYKISVLPVT